MKGARIGAFVAALVLFVCQVALAVSAGVSGPDVLLVVLATFAGFAAVVAVPVLLSRRRWEQRVSALVTQRPGWVGVRAITALPAGSPATGVRHSPLRCALLFGPQGVELWTGKKAPYQLLFGASWADVSVASAGVSYVPGRAVVKHGLRVTTGGGAALHLTVFPGRSVRERFPAGKAADSVCAAMRAAQAGAAGVGSSRPVWDGV